MMLLRRFGITSRQQRIMLSLIAICLAVVIAVLQDNGGAARDAAAPASRTLAPKTAAEPDTRAPTEEDQRAAAIAKAVRWLESQEGGPHRGHAIARHVGKSDRDLADRLAREDISAASTFYDLETAAAAIVRTIRHEPNDQRLRRWLADDETRRRLALRRAFAKPIGRIVYPDGAAREGSSAVAVLTKWRDGRRTTYRLLTAYVEP